MSDILREAVEALRDKWGAQPRMSIWRDEALECLDVILGSGDGCVPECVVVDRERKAFVAGVVSVDGDIMAPAAEQEAVRRYPLPKEEI